MNQEYRKREIRGYEFDAKVSKAFAGVLAFGGLTKISARLQERAQHSEAMAMEWQGIVGEEQFQMDLLENDVNPANVDAKIEAKANTNE